MAVAATARAQSIPTIVDREDDHCAPTVRDAAMHEAGHVVMALALGLSEFIDSIWVARRSVGWTGGVHLHWPTNEYCTDSKAFVREANGPSAWLSVALAGDAYCQLASNPHAVNSSGYLLGKDDAHLARECLMMLRPCDDEELLRAHWRNVVETLAKEAPRVEQLTSQLVQERAMTADILLHWWNGGGF
jgi:hypothetical protein